MTETTLYDTNSRKIYCGQINSSNQKHGFGTEYYILGNESIIKSKGNFKNDLPEDENFAFYNPQGQLQFKGNAVEGLKNGFGTEFHSNEQIKYEGYFINGKPDTDNEKQDTGKIYYANGNLEYIGSLKKGLYNGSGEYYNAEQILISKGNFVDGALSGSDCFMYHDNQNLKYTGEMAGNLFEGEGELYHENSALKYKGTFKRGRPDGKKCNIHHDNGQIKIIVPMINGYYEGRGKEYFKNGNLRYEGKFREGKYHGNDCKLYNEQGVIVFKGSFYAGQMEGDCQLFFDDGIIKFEGECVKGAPNGDDCKVYNEQGKSIYVGGMKDGIYHGKGECFEPGKEHKGKFKNGKPWSIM